MLPTHLVRGTVQEDQAAGILDPGSDDQVALAVLFPHVEAAKVTASDSLLQTSGGISPGKAPYLAKFLMMTLDCTGLEAPVLGTECGRYLPSAARSRRCGNHNHLARTPRRWKFLRLES